MTMVDEPLPANPSSRYRPNTAPVSPRGGLNLNIIMLDMRRCNLSNRFRYLEIGIGPMFAVPSELPSTKFTKNL